MSVRGGVTSTDIKILSDRSVYLTLFRLKYAYFKCSRTHQLRGLWCGKYKVCVEVDSDLFKCEA